MPASALRSFAAAVSTGMYAEEHISADPSAFDDLPDTTVGLDLPRATTDIHARCVCAWERTLQQERDRSLRISRN